MRRVAVTGMGIVSSIGNSTKEVVQSLRSGKSGVRFNPEYEELGLRCHVDARVKGHVLDQIDRKLRRFMGNAAAYGYIAMQQAIEDAGLTHQQVSHIRTGLIAGSGGASHASTVEAADILREKGIKRVGPYGVTKTMGSTVSANLATAYKIKGISYSISSACATSAHCIGNAYEQIAFGHQDIMFAGGAEEAHWTSTTLFDAMGALSTKYNATPEQASRPYDKDRDGFVYAEGGGIIVLEEYEHALARGAKIYAELVGYGVTTDGADMVAPSGEGAVRSILLAMRHIQEPIDYINTHGTSTLAGDIKELDAIKHVLGSNSPPISSTKSLTGHAQGAAGVHEAIYSILMMNENFIAPSANIQSLDPAAEGVSIVQKCVENVELNTVMSNSFGFGGTNATLIFSK